MATTEDVIELDSASSDDDYEEPPRKPIGWNYQSTASAEEKIRLMRYFLPESPPAKLVRSKKANGAVEHKPEIREGSGEDVEVMEVMPIEDVGSPKAAVRFPSSSSRTELRKQFRNKEQSYISDFFSKSPKPSVKSNSNSDKGNDKRKESTKTKTDVKEERKETKDTGERITITKIEVSKITDDKENVTNIPKIEPSSTDNSANTKENGDKSEAENAEDNSESSIAAVESFVCRWEEVKSSKEDNKIRDKLWKYYYLAHSSYTHSRKFISMVESATRKLSIDNIYVVIKDLLDSLKRYKDVPYVMKKKIRANGDDVTSSADDALPPAETEEEKKRNKKLIKIDKMMKKISDKIKELQEAEVDLDDEDNSAYLVEERLKRQFSKLYDYYCKLAQCPASTGRPIERKFKYTGSRYSEINKRISAWVNKTKEFPDYVDVLNLVKKVTKQSSLPLRPETIRVQAQEIFRDVGRLLKERRESDDLYNIYSYGDDDAQDPAANDEELTRKLTDNENVAKEKLDKIFQDYVEKDAELREAADKASGKKKKDDKEEKGEENTEEKSNETRTDDKSEASETKNEVAHSFSLDDEVQVEILDEEDDDDGEYDGEERYDVNDDDENDDDDDEEENDEHEFYEDYLDEQQVQLSHAKYEEDIDTDDDIKEVMASADVEDEEVELSEEDVPIMDSLRANETDDSNEIVILDDDDVPDLNAPTSFSAASSSSPTTSDSCNNKRKTEEQLYSPQKKLCP